MAKPECRYCGARVESFGDLCDDCFAEDWRDGIADIASDDLKRMQDRQNDLEY